MIRTFDPRYRGDHPMFDSADYCDMCNEAVDPKVGLNECGNALVCDACLERAREKAEADEAPG